MLNFKVIEHLLFRISKSIRSLNKNFRKKNIGKSCDGWDNQKFFGFHIRKLIF